MPCVSPTTDNQIKFLALSVGLLMLMSFAKAEPPNGHPKQSGGQVSIPTIPPGYPITEAQFRKVLNRLALKGTENWIKPEYAQPLGLSKNGTRVFIRQLAIEDDDAIEYGIALLKDGSGYMFDKGPSIGNRIAIRLDVNLNVVAAIAMSSTSEVTALPLSEAEARFREILATWAEYADTL